MRGRRSLGRSLTGKKSLIVSILLLFTLLAFTACGGDDESTTTEGVTTSAVPTTAEGETTTSEGEATTTESETTTSEGETTETSGGGGVDAAQLFTQNCASCHGGKGEGLSGPDLRPLTDNNIDDIEQQIRNGGGGMPAFEGVLTDEQIQALAEYVAGLE